MKKYPNRSNVFLLAGIGVPLAAAGFIALYILELMFLPICHPAAIKNAVGG
jgi:hypothetical protein